MSIISPHFQNKHFSQVLFVCFLAAVDGICAEISPCVLQSILYYGEYRFDAEYGFNSEGLLKLLFDCKL